MSLANLTTVALVNTNMEIDMKRYVIERNIPGVGGLSREQFKDVAVTSNGALAKLPGKAQWLQSFIVDD